MPLLMSRTTGKAITDLDHLRQSIIDIVSTPLGSRVYRRDYGCEILRLVDRPMNRQLLTRMYSAIAESLDRWEPRLLVTRIILDASLSPEGKMGLDLEGIYLPNGEPIRLEGMQILKRQATNG